MKAPAGWYLDPDREDLSRYWDGREWTNHRQTPDHDTGPIEAYVPVTEPRDVAGANDPTAGGDLASRRPGHSLLARLAELDSHGMLTVDDTRPFVFTPEAMASYEVLLGERAVAQQLAELGDEWTILHSIPIGRGTSKLDHIAIGPPGVFVVSTKRHVGESAWVNDRTMMMDGSRVAYLTNCAHDARKAAMLLTNETGFTVPSAGLLVLDGIAHITIRREPRFNDVIVSVTDTRRMRAHLNSQAGHLTPSEVERISEAARHPSTWRASPRTEFGVEQMAARLDTARRRDRIHTPYQQRRRRMLWVAGSATAGTVLLTALVVMNAGALSSWISGLVSALGG